MIGVQVSVNNISHRGRDVMLNCDRKGAIKLIEILQNLIDNNKNDTEVITGLDGWEDEPFIKDTDFYELANGIDINYCVDFSKE